MGGDPSLTSSGGSGYFIGFLAILFVVGYFVTRPD